MSFQWPIAPKLCEIWRNRNIWKCSKSSELFEKITFGRTPRKNSSQGLYEVLWLKTYVFGCGSRYVKFRSRGVIYVHWGCKMVAHDAIHKSFRQICTKTVFDDFIKNWNFQKFLSKIAHFGKKIRKNILKIVKSEWLCLWRCWNIKWHYAEQFCQNLIIWNAFWVFL